jgi:predicted CXXCH cytochrome family protein
VTDLLFDSLTARLRLLVVVICSIGGIAGGTTSADPANADPSVKYVGTERCIECHKDQHESYLKTTHSRSAERVDPEREPQPGGFEHELSGHSYQVLHRDGKLIHQETLRGVDGEALAVTAVPIEFTMGSGAHGKSYVFRSGPFFGQSPVSWFQETKKWGMSPGYDVPHHPGFRRNVGIGCFFCHVGSIDRKQGNPNDFTVLEEKIGCERCHGPGELHVAKYRADPNATGEDNTIVNPAKLSRALAEAVCQQCHLQAAGKAYVSGRHEWDYRPGLPLTDFRVDYQYQLGDDTMRIVGHVEQLHMSECYKQTETLTCVTCHDPHHTPPPENSVQYYRSICLKCHQDESCGKPRAERIELAANDCSQCHMPKKDTDVTHAAFRHHRIGIHSKEAVENLDVIAGLSPVLDISSLSKTEQLRCEALAKFQVAQADPGNPNFQNYGIDAAKALIEVKNTGKADADADTILATLAFDQGQGAIAANIAQQVVSREQQPSRARIEALRLLAQLAFQRRDNDQAVKLYREVNQYQRNAYDLYHQGMAEQNAGNTPQAVAALQKSIDVDPSQVEAHRALSAILHSIGRDAEANKHDEAVRKNGARMQKLLQKSRSLPDLN